MAHQLGLSVKMYLPVGWSTVELSGQSSSSFYKYMPAYIFAQNDSGDLSSSFCLFNSLRRVQ